MASLKAISTVIASVDAKKENLRKAFEDLQAHSSSLASFTLQWKELEEYLDSIKSSIEERFKELELKESRAGDGSVGKESPPHNVDSNGKQSSSAVVPVKVEESEITPPPELLSLCVKMDGKGLRSYVIEHRKLLSLIRDDVAVALKYASDPALIVLDAMLGLYPPNSRGNRESDLVALKTCVFLLEQHATISPKINPPVKEKAKILAVEWKGKLSTGGEDPLEILTFLQFVAAYDLVSTFSVDELLDLVLYIARRRQAIDLCRALGFTEKMPDFIQKLANKGKQLEAVKFIFAFGLADKFPPVPLLKTYVKMAKKLAQGIRKKGNDSIASKNEASAREITALRGVIRLVEEHDLESEFPCEDLEKRIEMLEKQKAERKRNAATPADKQQSRSKRYRSSAPVAAAATSDVPKTIPGPTSTLPPVHQNQLHTPVHQNQLHTPIYQNQLHTPVHQNQLHTPIYQNQLQQNSMLPDRVSPYMGSAAAGPYGLAGQSSVSPYVRTSSDLYGVGGVNPLGFGGHLSPVRSHLFPSELHPSGLYDRSSELQTSGLYDRSLTYGGYGLPPQNRPFYP